MCNNEDVAKKLAMKEENELFLKQNGIQYFVISISDDATTAEYRRFLKENHIHDYSKQQPGEFNAVEVQGTLVAYGEFKTIGVRMERELHQMGRPRFEILESSMCNSSELFVVAFQSELYLLQVDSCNFNQIYSSDTPSPLKMLLKGFILESKAKELMPKEPKLDNINKLIDYLLKLREQGCEIEDIVEGELKGSMLYHKTRDPNVVSGGCSLRWRILPEEGEWFFHYDHSSKSLIWTIYHQN